MNIPRRGFLFMFAGALLRADESLRSGLLVRSARPEDLEMSAEGFADYITPIDRFFVRTHVYVPMLDVSRWRLKVGGEVARALTLTLDAVRRLPSVELVSVAECAGNGRRFFEPPVPGVQWGNGAVGNGRWRGARLGDVLKQTSVKDSAREVLFDGADVPLGMMPDFQRSIPIGKALDSNTLLAYEMNGETLPLSHGFARARAMRPVRRSRSIRSGTRPDICGMSSHVSASRSAANGPPDVNWRRRPTPTSHHRTRSRMRVSRATTKTSSASSASPALSGIARSRRWSGGAPE